MKKKFYYLKLFHIITILQKNSDGYLKCIHFNRNLNQYENKFKTGNYSCVLPKLKKKRKFLPFTELLTTNSIVYYETWNS